MNWDTNLFYMINGVAGHWSWLDEFMRLISRPGTFLIPGLVALYFWCRVEGRKTLMKALLLAALVVTVDASGFAVKQLTARPRPCHVLPRVTKVTGCGRAFGFPSNHAVNTAASAMFFQMLYPGISVVAWPIVVLIGFSRVYVGAHYPSDVLGGWLIGVVGAWLVIFPLRLQHWLD
jgi:undecaprenyl-diphosphatase